MPRQPGHPPPAAPLLALLFTAIWLALTASLRAQDLSDWASDTPPPPPPDTPLVDNAGLFDRDPESYNRLTSALTRLRSLHHFTLIILTETALITNTPTELATHLQSHWIPDANGLVIVFEADSRHLGFGRSVTTETDLATLTGRPSSYQVLVVLGSVLKSLDTSAPPREILDALVTRLTSGFADAISRRNQSPPPGRLLRIALIAIGATATLALGALGLAWLLRRDQAARTLRHRFLPVTQPERLGAPHGAWVSSRRFGGSSSPPP